MSCAARKAHRLIALLGLVAGSVQGADFEVVWEFPTGRHMALAAVEDSTGRPFVYAALKDGGVLILETGGGAPVEAARVETRRLGGLDVMHIAQSEDRLLIALGDFFKQQSRAGLAIVSVANPRAPQVVDVWLSERKLHGSSTVLVDGSTAYLSAMKFGVFIFDVSAEGKLEKLSELQPDIHFPTRDPSRIQHPNARGAALDREHLYVADDAGGLRVLDVSDRRRPVEIGRYILSDMLGKQQAYNSVWIDGDVAYIAVDYCGLEVVDITDPRAIQPLGWWNPWRCDTRKNIWFNSPGHLNQIVHDAEAKRVYLSAGDSELQVVDVSDPKRPRLAASFGEPKNRVGTWGVGEGSTNLYLTYIQTLIPFRASWSGIRALRKPATPDEP